MSSYENFEDLNVSTMVLVARYEGSINPESIFCLLPVTYIDLPQRKRKTKKIKIPHCDIPGAILSLRFLGYTRGIFRTISKTHFRNSITIDIATSKKNVSLKLSTSSVHISGAKNVEMGKEAVDYLFGYIHEIQGFIEQLQSDLEETQKIFQWISNNCKGEECFRVEKDLKKHEGSNLNLIVHKTFSDHKLVQPTDDQIDNAPHDPKLIRFLLRNISEHYYYSFYEEDLKHIIEIPTVIEEPIEFIRIDKAMINYNYRLGFMINRMELKRVFDQEEEWRARYDHRIDPNVSIQLPYEVPEDQKHMRKKNKVHCHSFIVNASGVTTFSGPCEELMEDAYYRFMDIIFANKDRICCD